MPAMSNADQATIKYVVFITVFVIKCLAITALQHMRIYFQFKHICRKIFSLQSLTYQVKSNEI